MRFDESPEIKHQRRKGIIVMVLVCGPVFTIALVPVLYLAALLPGILFWATLAAAGGLAASIADRLGKYFKLTPQQFAGPVAFSCTLCPILAIVLIWNIFN